MLEAAIANAGRINASPTDAVYVDAVRSVVLTNGVCADVNADGSARGSSELVIPWRT